MSETSKDEQELAKALEGVMNPSSKPPAGGGVHNGVMQPIVPPNSPVAPQPAQDDSQASIPPPVGQIKVQSPTPQNQATDSTNDNKDTPPVVPVTPPMPSPATTDSETPPTDTPSEATPTSEPLDAIKNAALEELRPLVDKLDVKAEEKFDTYLLLIRSTDDMSLIAPAHEAAKGIEDEARRAQALLDIVKEIDYLSHQKS